MRVQFEAVTCKFRCKSTLDVVYVAYVVRRVRCVLDVVRTVTLWALFVID